MAKKVAYKEVLKIPSFTVLWIARIVSSLGDVLFAMATMWYVLSITDSPLAAAIVPLIPMISFALLAVPISTLADRFEKKKVLIGTDMFRALVVAVVGMLIVFDVANAAIIYVANLILAIAGYMFNPALQAAVPSILPDSSKQLAPANALLGATGQTIKLVGYGVGGVVIGFLDLHLAVFINAISYILSGVIILFVALPEIRAKSKKGIKGFIHDSLEGVRFIWGKRVFRICIAFGMLVNMVGAPLMIFTAVFSKQVLHAGTEGYGYLEAAFTAGGILGALIAGKFSSSLRLWQWFFLSYLITGTSLVVMALIPNLIVAILFSFFALAALSMLNIPLATSIQLASPPEMRGRVMNSFGMLISGLSAPTGLILGGWIMEVIGPTSTYVFVGIAIVVAGILSSFIPAFRDESELDEGFQGESRAL